MWGLSWMFTALKFYGCSPPKEYSLTFIGIVYTIYAIFLFWMITSSTLTQLLDMIFNVDNAEEFVENSYIMLTMLISPCKMINLVLKRKKIAQLRDALELYPFKPEDDEEIKIEEKYAKVIRWDTRSYGAMVASSVCWMALSSFYREFRNRRLMLRAWMPFDYTTPAVFFITYAYQVLGLCICCSLHVIADDLLCGFLTATYWQFEVLEYRLKKLTNTQQDELWKCVIHHNLIYEYATSVNSTFKITICTQFIVSTLVVCFTLYRLVTLKSFNTNLLQLLFYIICIVVQIFLYCWFGNEVKIKSLETGGVIFSLDWTHLSIKNQKILMMIMKRAMIPIEFTSAHIITMNLDSFVNLLKISYSTYNLLQQTKEN